MRNFFEHQDRARRSTRVLVMLMALGVLAMGLAIYGLLSLMASFRRGLVEEGAASQSLLVWSVLGTAAVVAGASLVRLASLRGGGAQVAEMMGGRLVSGAPRDSLDKRVLNVVEEMAIAAGAPVPLVFVLDNESGINAFAAGLSLGDAAVAVTRGCLEKLTREELQGVIAHEMSHVLNGDMRLNTRLMGVVFGIVCIGLFGRLLLRLGSSGARSYSSRRSSGGVGAGLLVLGLGVMAIGAIGELFGKLIKAGVSRQRELLADASAVQFTRNPIGITGALKKIGGWSRGAQVDAIHAEEASHFFFSDIHKSLFFGSWLATHPPLVDRIRRIDPSFGGQFPEVADQIAAPADHEAQGFAPATAARLHDSSADAGEGARASSVVGRIGTAGEAEIARAEHALHEVPGSLSAAASVPFSAVALVYALLLGEDAAVVHAQHARICELSGGALEHEVHKLAAQVRELPRSLRMPLLQLALPALRQLSARQRAAFVRTTQALVDADDRLSVFEHVVSETLRLRLREHEATLQRTQRRRLSLASVGAELQLVLSLIAHAGAYDEDAAQRAFAAGIARTRLPLPLLPRSERLLSGLGPALVALHGLSPSHLQTAVDAASHCALADRRVTDEELTLLHAVCDALDCPLPI